VNYRGDKKKKILDETPVHQESRKKRKNGSMRKKKKKKKRDASVGLLGKLYAFVLLIIFYSALLFLPVLCSSYIVHTFVFVFSF
jgi:hypothetical protein